MSRSRANVLTGIEKSQNDAKYTFIFDRKIKHIGSNHCLGYVIHQYGHLKAEEFEEVRNKIQRYLQTESRVF